MGCDIHIFVERRDPRSGAWVAIDGPGLAYQYHAQRVKEGKEDAVPSYAHERSYGGWFWFPGGRNYTLFALLAGVRNYDEITPISPLRDLPKDVSARVLKAAQDWGNDGHSPSWYSYRELKDVFVTAPGTVTVGGLITLDDYGVLKENGTPPQITCRGAGGPNTRIITMETADEIRSGALPLDPNARYFVDATWPVSVAEVCKDFVYAITERLAPVAEEAGEENIRVVFWFDN